MIRRLEWAAFYVLTYGLVCFSALSVVLCATQGRWLGAIGYFGTTFCLISMLRDK